VHKEFSTGTMRASSIPAIAVRLFYFDVKLKNHAIFTLDHPPFFEVIGINYWLLSLTLK
jgi:hypothetical protein